MLDKMRLGQSKVFGLADPNGFYSCMPQDLMQSYEALSSEEQDKYQAYFKEKLKKHGVDSPAKLGDAQKAKFFEEVKKDWK